MKNLKMFYVLICAVIGWTPSWSADDMAIEDKENNLPNYTAAENTNLPMQIIDNIKGKINEAHKKAYEGKSFTTLRQVNRTFRKLKYSEKSWEAVARQLGAYKWPGQNWKQSVGGHLFYPGNVNDLLASPFTLPLVERIDMIWSFAIAAKYHNPLGQYYLGWTLSRVRARYTDAERPEFLSNILKDSLNTLYQCQDHPDACYVLGVNLTGGSYQGQGAAFTYEEQKKINIYKEGEYDPEEGLRFYEQGGNLQNRVAALQEKFYCSNDPMVQRPTVDEYLVLAKEGCGAAYIEAAELIEDNVDLAITYLKKAVNLNFPQALINLGILYEGRADYKNAIKYYKKAGKKGIGKGYVMISEISLGGDISLEKYAKNLSQVSKEDITKAIHYLTLAGNANEMEGWDQLAVLYHNLYQIDNKEEYIISLASVLERGAMLGSSRAYLQIRNLFIKNMDDIVQTYGRPPQADLYKDIESFLKRSF